MVVLARSKEGHQELNGESNTGTEPDVKREAPKTVNLDDDTLLESISFSKDQNGPSEDSTADIPASLASLDPSKQPLLRPLDSAVLLSLASDDSRCFVMI